MKLLPLLSLVLFNLLAYSQPDKQAFTDLDVFELEYADDPQISPDGKKVVYVRRGLDIMKDKKYGRLWIIDSNGKNHRKLTSREVSESSPRWSPSGDRIAYISATDDGSEMYVYWLSSGQFSRISQLPGTPSGLSWSPDGRMLAFSMKVAESNPILVKSPKKPKGAEWADAPRVTVRLKHEQDGSGYITPGYAHLFVIPAEGNTPRQVTSGAFHHKESPAWTRDGKALIFSSNRNEDWEFKYRNSDLYKVDIESGDIVALTHRNGPDEGAVVSPDGRMVAYLGYDDKVQTYQVNRICLMQIDGSGNKEIATYLDRHVSNLQWDAEGQGLYFQYDDQGNTKIGYTSTEGDLTKVVDDVGGTRIGRPYTGGSYSIASDETMAFTFGTPYHPADVAIVSRGKSMSRLTTLNNDLLKHRELGEVEEIWYEASTDQRQIQGWIVKPPQFDVAQKYPLLVENHGGPISNYGDRFSPEMQLYAAAGYVVFYPNPRGSTSYGEAFGNLLYNNYPGDDYQDVMDGVDAMIARGYIDEEQLFVTGGSAGGIMTAWIIGKNHRFAAASVVKPVMNWISKTLVADNYFGYANYRYPGQPWENFETYWKFSPISLVGNVETPTLVMVGQEDLRTPLSESKQLYHALKLRKIPTALVEFPGAYHNIANRPSQMISKVAHTLAWFEKYR